MHGRTAGFGALVWIGSAYAYEDFILIEGTGFFIGLPIIVFLVMISLKLIRWVHDNL